MIKLSTLERLKQALVLIVGVTLVFANFSVSAGQIITYVHTDRLGNPVAKTNSVGAVIWRQSYTPYGETHSQTDPDGPGFTGHRHDAATGLVYMQARYYDPKIGRFLSPDPVTFSPSQPDHFNLYWYANGNPYKYTDPTGRETGLALQNLNRMEGVKYPQVPTTTAGKIIAGGVLVLMAAPVAALLAPEAVEAAPEAAEAAAPEATAAGEEGSASNASKVKAIRSLEKQIGKHQQKIKEFKVNPTVRPGMENQPKNIIRNQQKQRVQHLKKEVKTFKKNIKKIKDGKLDS